ncbi:unnamed protein product [Durusdinium trenchii]|uniref:J domain-containing protein n=2 Tax=Durusdinium trenchii TaxID=1381693 RepID=A0ABP0IRK6_9DINO
MALAEGVPDVRLDLPRIQDARALFEPFLPCDDTQLRKIYLRLALKYHPDKLLKAERSAATELFQAIAAVYEDLLRPFGGKIPKRVKTQTAAAAELGDVKALQRLLIELPSRAVEEDYVGAVPLMFAAKGGCIEAAELLVRYNADVHAETPFGWSVLVYAALSDQGHMVRWLAKEGARVTGHELQLAAFGGYHRGLEALIEHYDQELSAVKTSSGNTLLHLLCLGILNIPKGQPERYLKCLTLLAPAVPPNVMDSKRGLSPIQLVAGHGNWLEHNLEASNIHLKFVEQLCAAKADPNAMDKNGQSAVSLARRKNLNQVASILQRFAASRL